MTTLRVALAGAGAWGSNLLRVLRESPRARLVAVAEPDPRRRAQAQARAPEAAALASLDEALALGLDAVVLATPADTHAELALAALEAGADVFAEKPLATRESDADRCEARARELGRVAMVGHLLRYHPVVVRLLEIARSGALGALQHLEAARLSTAGDRSASVLWTLGPHDLSVLQALDPSPLRALHGSAAPSLDAARLSVELDSGLTAEIALSRVHTSKERRIAVIGAERAAVFDDVRAPDRLLLGRAARRRGGALEIRIDAEAPVPFREPLALEIDHFLACVEGRAAPLTSFADGARVVAALARAERALARKPLSAAAPEPSRPAFRSGRDTDDRATAAAQETDPLPP